MTTNAAIYPRVSTNDQTCENELLELLRYCVARGWTVTEYVDSGVSGAKERRPSLDRLMTDARQWRVDAIVVWRLDRFGRNRSPGHDDRGARCGIRHTRTALIGV